VCVGGGLCECVDALHVTACRLAENFPCARVTTVTAEDAWVMALLQVVSLFVRWLSNS